MKMLKKYHKSAAFVLAVLFMINLFGACKKGDATDTQASGNGTKSVTASMTASKTTSKATSMPSTSTNNAGDSTNKASEENRSTTNVSNNVSDNRDSKKPGTIEEQADGSPSGETGTPDSSASESKTYNLNGRELLILTSVGMLPKPENEWTNKMDEVRYKLYIEAEELYNCKYDFQVISDLPGTAKQVASSVMAGVYMCDVFYCGRANAFPSLEKGNILLPLNDYIDFNQPAYQEHQHINGLVNPDKIYSFFNTYLTPVGVFYVFNPLSKEPVSPAPAIDSIKEQVQTIIDDIMEN
jgi:hypothetical protein